MPVSSDAFGFRTAPSDHIDVDFGAGPHSMIRSMVALNLSSLVPPEGPVDFTPLDEFPQAKTIDWSGPGRGLEKALATRPRFRFVHWRGPAGDIDLSGSGVEDLRMFDCAGVRSLRLPETIKTLLLDGPAVDLRVEATGERHGLDLRLWPAGAGVVIPEGLLQAEGLSLRVGGEFSVATLSGFIALTDLELSFGGEPGTLTDVHLLAGHPYLRSLQLNSAFGLDPATLPDPPALRHLHLDGTRKKIAKALRARFRDTDVKLCVSGALSDRWLIEQRDNPFEGWVDYSKKAAKAAGAAYARARRSAEAGAAGQPVDAERALRRFIADLNAIDEKYGAIDTEERGQVVDVYEELAGRFHLDPRGEAAGWLAEDRRF